MKISILNISIILLILPGSAFADTSNQPYIDQLKQKLPSGQNSDGYTDNLKNKLPQDTGEDSSVNYADKLRRAQELKLQGSPGSSGSYSEQEKQKLEPKPEGGAIEAVREGHSDLKMRKSLDIHQAAGVRYGVGETRNFTANQIGTGRSFNSIYGSNYAPDVSLFYELQPFHGEMLGSLGFFGMGTVAYFNGIGQFATTIPNAFNGSPISSSNVKYRFFQMPAVVGADYRFNLFKYVRPYVMGGPTAIGFFETRNDGGPTHQGISYGLWGTVGVSFLMDWVDRSSDWDRYSAYNIKHTYFTVEYSKLSTFASSPVDFSVSGPYAGIVFEF